ncbi:MAG: enoyl-CoA hydratase-related protein [Rhodospirillaceae bacterium]|nr:enoyl-CoA hydratase-related protein [Rhodospirillaceae bacterium]
MPNNAFYEHEMLQKNYDRILIEKRPNGVAVATLNKPDKLNAIDPNMHLEVTQLARDLDEDPALKVLVLTGAGRGFCAGGDFSPERSRFSGERIWREARQLVDDFLDCEKPIITAMNGPAMGLGATIALLGDVVFAARSASIGDTHVRIGVGAGDGGQVYWPLLMGPQRAKYYMMTGDVLTAEEAERQGLVNFVVDDDKLMEKTMELANRLAEGPSLAISASKMGINKYIKFVSNLVLPYTLQLEKFNLYASKDAEEAMDAFRNRREPQWKGQ